MTESPYVIEGEETLREGERRQFAVIWDDFSAITTNGCEAYINGSSDSGNLLSGSSAVAGNTLTLPTLTVPAGSGGVTIVLEPHVGVSGVSTAVASYKTGLICRILKPGAER